MRTFLYNTVTKQRVGDIRQGRYLVDGKPATLPPELIELELVSLPEPSYNTNTHSREEKEYVDLNKKQWVKEYYLRQLSQDEINSRTIQSPPHQCTLKKFRLALIQCGISLSDITLRLNAINNVVEKETLLTEWEYSDFIKINSPIVNKISEFYTLSISDINSIFIATNNIE